MARLSPLTTPGPPARRWRWPSRWVPLIVWGALTVVSSAVFIGVEIVNAEAARSWPTTTGRIEASDVRTVHFRRNGPYDRYEPHVEYSYAVAGRAYRSARISWGGRAMYQSFDEAVADLARDYPVGRAVVVFYAPANPAEAILTQDNYYLGPFLMLPVGLVLLGVGVLGRRRAAGNRTPAMPDRFAAAG